MARRSIGFPLTIGIVLSLLAIALLVAWQILVVGNLRPVADGLTVVHWVLLILGTLFFALIIVGLGLLCAWLIREMRLNQRQQAFLDAVTHEMKTPLASLRLYLDTLVLHDPLPQERREFLARMREDVERLDRTVHQVLAAARAEERVRKAQLEWIELSPLLERCISEIRARHALSHEAVRLEASTNATVRGDPAELGLVFRNLLENAVKYSEPPVDVRVGVTLGIDERVHVEIVDRGIGIPRKELRKIFQRFYRAGRDVQRKAAGLGLGLFIVRNLVRRQGGRVVARSEGSGRGSRFVVSLRAAPGKSEALASGARLRQA
ncbi:MAG TPA: HAMP domain-containing sensor histidine kinase [Myxococcota bacterium]|nr:HAMP domain-containing sensor histidine kinase [Myxococcota bacterium]